MTKIIQLIVGNATIYLFQHNPDIEVQYTTTKITKLTVLPHHKYWIGGHGCVCGCISVVIWDIKDTLS